MLLNKQALEKRCSSQLKRHKQPLDALVEAGATRGEGFLCAQAGFSIQREETFFLERARKF